jgi:hypothetical protein
MDYKKVWEQVKYSFLSDEQKAVIRAEEQRKAYELEKATLEAQKPAPFDLFSLPLPVRFGHTHILAESGGGKSSLIESLILHDLESEYRPTVVVVDSQGDLIQKLLRLDLPEDPVYINPRHPPPINLFESGGDANAAIETLLYLFSAQLVDPSGKMLSLFEPLCRLMFSIPNATLYTMLEFLRNPEGFDTALHRLSDIEQEFFKRDVFGKGSTYSATMTDLRVRLNTLTNTPEMRPFFTSTKSSLDFYSLLNSRKLILVDSDKATLKEKASKLYGRLFISLFLRAALERAKIPEQFRTASFLYVDEAHEYFDSKTEQILTEARKYKFGCVLAHQRLAQCSPELKSALMGSTRIKLATYLNTDDQDVMERAFDITPVAKKAGFHISGTPFTFSCSVKGIAWCEKVTTTKDILESRPQRKDIDALMERNAALMRPSSSTEPAKKITKEVDSEEGGAY